ncbi:MAG: MFS transporter [Kofleriaceae bacterium]
MTKQRRLEFTVAVWGAVTFGALLASSSVFRPVRDSLVLDGNPDNIPWLFVGTFAGTLLVSPLWSAALGSHGHRRLVPIAFHVFAACAIGFGICVALEIEPVVVGRVFYIWASVFNMFVVSVFWSLLADLLGPDTARRLFGPIAAGGTIGAIAGPALTRVLVGWIGVEGVLVVSAGLLEIAVIAVAQVQRAGESFAREAAAPAPKRGGPLDGIAQVARSKFLLAIAGYVLCTAITATFLYLEQAKLAKLEYPDRDARTELFATIDLGTNLLALVLQTLLAAPLLKRFGPGIVLLLLPIAQLAGLSMVVMAPSIAALMFAQITSRALTHGLTRPSRELLFTVVDRDEKYRAKNVIDTVVLRFGDVAASFGHTGLLAIGAGTGVLVIASIPVGALWVACALALGVMFRRRKPEEAP